MYSRTSSIDRINEKLVRTRSTKSVATIRRNGGIASVTENGTRNGGVWTKGGGRREGSRGHVFDLLTGRRSPYEIPGVVARYAPAGWPSNHLDARKGHPSPENSILLFHPLASFQLSSTGDTQSSRERPLVSDTAASNRPPYRPCFPRIPSPFPCQQPLSYSMPPFCRTRAIWDCRGRPVAVRQLLFRRLRSRGSAKGRL